MITYVCACGVDRALQTLGSGGTPPAPSPVPYLLSSTDFMHSSCWITLLCKCMSLWSAVCSKIGILSYLGLKFTIALYIYQVSLCFPLLWGYPTWAPGCLPTARHSLGIMGYLIHSQVGIWLYFSQLSPGHKVKSVVCLCLLASLILGPLG